MKFITDLHVHSKFSRATAKNMDLENLYISAQLKGITVVGTGDFTHPGWFSEIKEKLQPAEEGLFKLKDDLSQKCDEKVPLSCRNKVRFILTSEISNIYKKKGKTRKNHNLVFMPDLDSAYKLNLKLDKIGNIKSDGRPILGLDVRDLLEIILEISDSAFIIPAHIWTPWFSLFGSKSGFDSIEECFEDLTPHIFAIETGLSSDPPMNWRVSGIDGLTLVSNSDAHSPLNLGREANIFNTALSYPKIMSAIRSGNPKEFLGTFEFYPEEGKYHLDGHRKCKVCLKPSQSIANKGLCNVCGKPLTLGVLYRIEELADRPEGSKPKKSHPYYNLIPLSEILSEILNVGPKSKKVQRNHMAVLESLGPELEILHNFSIKDIEKAGIPLLGEAVNRMRKKQVTIFPGYDGEYGKVKVFRQGEKEKLLGQKQLFAVPVSGVFSAAANTTVELSRHQKFCNIPKKPDQTKYSTQGKILDPLNKDQLKAVKHKNGPLLIVAGPGTGKTLTLTHRIAYIITERKVSTENILAVTFTNKAAQEMRDRLLLLMDNTKDLPEVTTFHSFCFKILKGFNNNKNYTIIDDNDRKTLISEAIKQAEIKGGKVSIKPSALLNMIISAKQNMLYPQDKFLSTIYKEYQSILSTQNLYDYEDLIFNIARLLESDMDFCKKYRDKYKHIFVDEYQDLNQGQHRIIKALTNPDSDICVIGDPDQSIYGFRGSDVRYFKNFLRDYPKASTVNLNKNYRSTETILEASYQTIKNHKDYNALGSVSRVYSDIKGSKKINVIELVSEKAEAVTIGKIIEKMIGGIGFHSIDYGSVDSSCTEKQRGFSDFAVLFRSWIQSKIIADVFDRANIPHQIISRENAFNSKGISELLSFLKIIDGRGSYIDFERIIYLLKSGVGKKSLETFKTWGYKNRLSLKEATLKAIRFPVNSMSRPGQQKLCEFIDKVSKIEKEIKDLTIEEKLLYLSEKTKIKDIITEEALNNLIIMTRNLDIRSSDFFSSISLHSDTDIYSSRAEKVSLMTMHTAKGLEFPVVFIAGCEDGFIPMRKHGHEEPDINEERRLFYVAMTRARERLYFTYAKKRRIYGKMVAREVSPFINDIEKSLIKHEEGNFKKIKKKTEVQLKLF
ncbi:MAG: UvrD-helicase domain-containing protein [Proteobacteria bacterium]|nr:UvrD-helicase domain-containing protein [Pseudomonadota bacterium]MBU4288929.1 UvrD-helicase domain-containing protein [Pseudomonadota bacterium]MBU4415212.1 UvrD-helicase domain-containing protein [Pseudomonadota bacterium]MCG2758359.1 UvrD-helicase domain-containing protein [Desulfobacteraceae bacterium]